MDMTIKAFTYNIQYKMITKTMQDDNKDGLTFFYLIPRMNTSFQVYQSSGPIANLTHPH